MSGRCIVDKWGWSGFHESQRRGKDESCQDETREFAVLEIEHDGKALFLRFFGGVRWTGQGCLR
jgi:hypothetical protein